MTNTYSIGNITGVSQIGSVSGGTESTNITNAYYLENTVLGDVEATIRGTSKTQTEMQTSTFAELLGTNWKYVENKNNGYPILSWQ